MDKTNFETSDFETSGKRYSINTLEYVFNNFPELQRDSAFAAQVTKHLQDRGLIKSDDDPDYIASEDSERRIGIPNTYKQEEKSMVLQI